MDNINNKTLYIDQIKKLQEELNVLNNKFNIDSLDMTNEATINIQSYMSSLSLGQFFIPLLIASSFTFILLFFYKSNYNKNNEVLNQLESIQQHIDQNPALSGISRIENKLYKVQLKLDAIPDELIIRLIKELKSPMSDLTFMSANNSMETASRLVEISKCIN